MSQPKAEVHLRRAARVLVLNSNDQILLFDVALAYTRAWITPGGRVEPGETYEKAALRELGEETGIREIVLSPCVWTLDFRFVYDGITYDQRERYFVARVTAHAVSRERWTESEASEIQRVRWWSLGEILASTADFRPANLAALLRPILAGDYPSRPIAALVERSARTV